MTKAYFVQDEGWIYHQADKGQIWVYPFDGPRAHVWYLVSPIDTETIFEMREELPGVPFSTLELHLMIGLPIDILDVDSPNPLVLDI